MRYTQPQSGPIRIDTDIGADFAWIASIGKLAGPSVSASTASKAIVKAGIGINSGYAIVASTIPSLYTTTWTECGVVLLDGTNAVTTLGARDTGQSIVFQPASSQIDIVMWGVVDVFVTGTLPVGITHYAIRRVGSAHTIWLNGKLYGASSASNSPIASSSILPAVGAQAGSGGSQGGGPLTATTGMLSVVRTPKALPDAQCLALSNNHWQLYKSPQRVMLAAAGGTSYSYTATGGMVLSGAATKVRGIVRTPAGGAQFSGAATQLRGIVKTPSGGILFAGAAAQARGKAYTASGGLTLSGAANVLRGLARTASGGLLFSGAAGVTFFSAVQSRVVTPVGGIILGGAAAIVRTCTRIVSGGIKLGGTSPVEFFSILSTGASDWMGYIRRRGRR